MIHAHLPVLIPLSLLVGALTTTILGMWRAKWSYALAVVFSLLSLLLAVVAVHAVLTEGTIRYALAGWLPPIGIEYVLDPLAAFMVAVVLLIALLVLIHSAQNVEAELPGRSVAFYSVSLLLLAGFCGIILTGDLFNLYVFLEISSLAGYALIAVGEKGSPVAAFRYLLIGTVGASFFLLGLAFIYISTGSLNIKDLAALLAGLDLNPAIIVGLTLMTIGMLIKMAMFPLHGWQPDAYTLAPTTTTALLAPIGTKVAAYVVIRILFFVFEPSMTRDELPVTDVLTWLSLAAILFGSVMAMAQKELKRMLAYSSVAQIGYIGLGIGLANPLAFAGAVLHILNHAFMKGGLFLVVGNIRLQAGHSFIPQFNNSLQQAMPWTMAAFCVFSLSMVGIPPLAGFFSKWYLVLGGLENGDWVAVAVILASSLLNAVYFFRVIERMYLLKGTNPSAVKEEGQSVHEVGARMLAPTLIMAAGLFILGFLNAVIVGEMIARMLPPGL